MDQCFSENEANLKRNRQFTRNRRNALVQDKKVQSTYSVVTKCKMKSKASKHLYSCGNKSKCHCCSASLE